MIGNIARASHSRIAVTAATAASRLQHDLRWRLEPFHRHHRGACETYNFPVRIANGNVTFPGWSEPRAVSQTKRRGWRRRRGDGQVRVGFGTAEWRIGQRALDRPLRQVSLLGKLDRAAG